MTHTPPCRVLAALGGAALAAAAGAEPVLYHLSNHPGSQGAPPAWGLRLDEMYDATPDHDAFTFDFNAEGSAMFMELAAGSIHIFGKAWGGRDVGNQWADDGYLALYNIDFLYNHGVERAPGDDDMWVDGPNRANTGWIWPEGGDIATQLADERLANPYSFRFGDEDNDLGHAGWPGKSGWGWLNHGDVNQHVEVGEWMFTARLVPTPGSVTLAGLGAALAIRRRKRR